MSVDLDKSSNQSTQMAFAVIEALAEIGRPVSLADLSRRMEVSKVRVFRFLRTLLQLGYVLQDAETDRYRLSFKLYHLGQAVANSADLLRDARPVMDQLAATTGMTVSLSQPEAGGMRIIEMVRSYKAIEIVTRPGALLSFHGSAQGKIAVAFGKVALGEAPLAALTPATPTDPAAIEEGLAAIRARGWAEAANETLPGVNAISAPVYDMTGAFFATLTIAGPTQIIGAPPRADLIQAVVNAARLLSSLLGNTE